MQDEEIYSSDDLKFSFPSTILVSGPTSSGKTMIIYNLIRHRQQIFDISEKINVLYCLPARQKIEVPSDIRGDIKFAENIPDFNTIQGPAIVVLDDLASEVDSSVVQAFVRHSHHRNLTIILVTHNIFDTGKKNFFRTISLNTSLFFLTRNRRDSRQISVLGSQLLPSNPKALVEIYNDATSRKFGYLIIDCGQNTDEKLRFRTNIFPSEGGTIIYRI